MPLTTLVCLLTICATLFTIITITMVILMTIAQHKIMTDDKCTNQESKTFDITIMSQKSKTVWSKRYRIFKIIAITAASLTLITIIIYSLIATTTVENQIEDISEYTLSDLIQIANPETKG